MLVLARLGKGWVKIQQSLVNLPALDADCTQSLPKMTKKTSIFKLLQEYFLSHPQAVLGWIWVMVMPAIGSLVLLRHSDWLVGVAPENLFHFILLTLSAALLMGLALLPTTLTSIAMGFFYGWVGLPSLILAYVLANVIGYQLGRKLNLDFLPILTQRNPELKGQIEARAENLGELIFFVRISPVIPFAISNFLFATLEIGLAKVIRFGIPGMLPRTLIAFGTGMAANSFLAARTALNDPIQWIVLLIFLAISFWGIIRTWKRKKA